MTGIRIRPIAPEDAETVAALCGELGYPLETQTIERRLQLLQSWPDHTVLVACTEPDGRVAGWIDVGLVFHLPSEPYGEIGGLVIAEDLRSQGIGKALLAAAESWIKQRGIQRALVRSRITRERTHQFYLREGYTQTKTSAVFVKPLSPDQHS